MNSDPFEERLREQPVRQVPPEWRDQILKAALQSARPQATTPTTKPGRGPGNLLAILCRSLWPHPAAWAGVAAVWALGIALQLACIGPAPAKSPPFQPAQTSLESLLTEQRKELGQLLNPPPSTPPSTQSPRHGAPVDTEAVRPGQGAVITIPTSIPV